MFFLASLISKAFGLDISKVQRWLVIGMIVLIAIAVLALGLWLRSCFHKAPSLNQEEITKAQQAIAANDRKVMVDILANSNARQAATDQTVDNAKAAANDAATQARKDAANMSNEELAAELERRAKE